MAGGMTADAYRWASARQPEGSQDFLAPAELTRLTDCWKIQNGLMSDAIDLLTDLAIARAPKVHQ